jgi:DeoR/GlpR family transcriptional regulator of sugar metabolism
MLPTERDAVILRLLNTHGTVTVSDLAIQCNCSPMSVRRDLHRLEEQGIVKRTHGGAILAAQSLKPPVAPNGKGILAARSALVDRADALIVTPVKTLAMDLLIERARRAGVRVVAESIHYPGAATIVAIDDFRAGVELGCWVAAYVRERLTTIQVLDISSSLPNTAARSRGFAEGLRESLPYGYGYFRVEGRDVRSLAFPAAADALAVHPGVNVIFGVNDDSALGALDAYRAAGLDESQLVVVCFGLEGNTSRELLARRGPLKAVVAMFPELVGRTCIDVAVCAHHRHWLPERITMPYAIVTAETLDQYYVQDERTPNWRIEASALQRLLAGNQTLSALAESDNGERLARIGYIQVYSSHEWYHNVQLAMRERSQALGIRLEVIDASHDVEQEIDRLDRAVGHAAAGLVTDGDTVILDNGRPGRYLAEALRGRNGITVITNSFDVLAELIDERGIRVLSCGGVLRSESRGLTGRPAEEFFRDLRAHKAFLTGGGLSLNFGLSCRSTSEQAVKQAMLHAAREVIVLADHTKIGAESLVKIAPLESIQRLITDGGISPHDQLALRQHNIEVIIADEA